MMLLQYVLLGLFGLCAVISFVSRVRMGSLEGAIERGEKDDDKTRAAAAFLLLCGAVGAARVL